MVYFYKRFFGVSFSLVMLLILFPLFVIIAIAVKLESRGPVIFKQNRMGYKGKQYNMYKFRSMVVGAQFTGSGLYSFNGDPRITRVGRILRKTSLDELPQLLNILKGDMAFVGPRSPVVDGFPEYELLNQRYKRRFDVFPGITGLAQAMGRNGLSWDEKVEYDNVYIDNVYRYWVFYDLRIIFITIARVFSMNDVEESQDNMMRNKESFAKQVTSHEIKD